MWHSSIEDFGLHRRLGRRPGGRLDATGPGQIVVTDRICRRKKEGHLSVTAIRVKELDRRTIVWGKYEHDVVGLEDRSGTAHREPDGRAAQCSA
jgi:hypothetical protein